MGKIKEWCKAHKEELAVTGLSVLAIGSAAVLGYLMGEAQTIYEFEEAAKTAHETVKEAYYIGSRRAWEHAYLIDPEAVKSILMKLAPNSGANKIAELIALTTDPEELNILNSVAPEVAETVKG